MDAAIPLIVAATVALAAAVAVFFLTRALRRDETAATEVRWALAGGYVAAHVALAGVPRIPPSEGWQWVLLLVPAAALLGMAEARGAIARSRPLLRGALFAFAAWATLLPPAWWQVALIAAASLLCVGGLDKLAEEPTPAPFLVAVLVAAAAASGAIVVSQWPTVGSSRVDLQACKLEYSIVSPK